MEIIELQQKAKELKGTQRSKKIDGVPGRVGYVLPPGRAAQATKMPHGCLTESSAWYKVSCIVAITQLGHLPLAPTAVNYKRCAFPELC